MEKYTIIRISVKSYFLISKSERLQNTKKIKDIHTIPDRYLFDFIPFSRALVSDFLLLIELVRVFDGFLF